MRLYFLIPLFAITFTVSLSATVTNRENFLNRVMRYVKIFNKQQTGQLTDPILSDIAALKTMDQIAGNVMGYAIAIFASNMLAALPLLTLKGNMDTCLKPYKSDTMSMLTPVMSGAGLAVTKAYKLMKKKVTAMKGNGKTTAQIVDQLNYLGAAMCTPDLVQHLLWLVQKNLTAGQWSCCCKYMPQLFILAPPEFDLTYRPNKWIYPYKK